MNTELNKMLEAVRSNLAKLEAELAKATSEQARVQTARAIRATKIMEAGLIARL